jgi:transcriptional regulator with XRE-family HTH domain
MELPMQYFLRTLLEENNTSLEQLSLKCQISEAELAAYVSGERKPDQETLQSLSKALQTSSLEFRHPVGNESQFSKYQLIEFFIESLHELERRTTSAPLESNDYQKLLRNIEALGGWQELLDLTEKELFERQQREKHFEQGRSALLKAALPRAVRFGEGR